MLRFDYHNERQNPVGGKQVMPGAIEAPHPARILATPPGLVRAESRAPEAGFCGAPAQCRDA